MPSPRTLKGYEEILPGCAERIIKSFEIQSTHRQSLEKKVVKGQVNQSFIGQILGFIIALLFLLAGTHLIANDHDIAGAVISSLDIVGLVGIFVLRKYNRQKTKESI